MQNKNAGLNNKIPWLTLVFFIFVIGLGWFLWTVATPHNQPDTTDQAASVIFSIGWGHGTFARPCQSTECDPVYSFREPTPVELPYKNVEELPDWVDMSTYCEEQCFVHKSAFSTDPDTATIVADWENRVVLIVCNDNAFGSGLLTWSDNQPAVVTAKHVIDGKESCTVRIPQNHGYKTVSKDFFEIHPSLDLGIILLGKYAEINDFAKEPINRCDNGSKGDDVLVIGYPEQVVNAQIYSPSVTQGIISNQSDLEYATTVDIGHGYSGGVAVKKKDGCYLGVPIAVAGGTDHIGNIGITLKATNLQYGTTTGFSF